MSGKKWVASFKVKDLLTDEDLSPSEVRQLVDKVVERLDDSPFNSYSQMELIWEFEDAYDEKEFNDAMDILYGIADDERIWIE